jgi:hypothetical protein
LLFGIAAGWLAVRTGGLEASITLHTVNNLGAFLVPAATGQLGNALRVTETPWQAIAGTIVQLVAFAVLVLLSARRRRLPRVTGSASPQPGPVDVRAPVPVAGPIPGALQPVTLRRLESGSGLGGGSAQWVVSRRRRG